MDSFHIDCNVLFSKNVILERFLKLGEGTWGWFGNTQCSVWHF